MSLLPLPKRYHPDFSQPGRKPVGPVEVDWDNQLSRGLKAFVMLTKEGAVNIVDDKVYAVDATLNLPFTAYDVNGSRLSGSNNDKAHVDELAYLVNENKTSGTIAAIFKRVGTQTGQRYIVGSRISGGDRFYLGIDGNNFFTSLGDYTPASIGTVVNNKLHIGAMSWDGSNEYSYFDGVEGASRSGGSFSGTLTLFSFLGLSTSSATTFTLDGGVYFMAFYDRPLSDAEHAALARDPYQILKPQTPPVYFVPDAGGSTYTLSADPTGYTLGSDNAELQYDQIMTATATSYTLGSDNVNLTYTPAGSYTLTATATAYSLGSDNVNLEFDAYLSADATAYTLGSDNVNLTYEPIGASTLNADPTAYTLGSDSVNLVFDTILSAEPTAYTLTFAAASLDLGVLDTPNCYTYVVSEIEPYEYLHSIIDDSATYVQSAINNDVEYVQSLIDDSVIYVKSELCACP